MDGEGEVAKYSSLALDGEDNPHISYLSDDGLRYARWTGSAWERQTVATDATSEGVSLALDRAGNPRIAYASGDGPVYARWTGSGWEIWPVGSSGAMGLQPSLAIDGVGHAHISYYDYLNKDLKYALQPCTVSLPLIEK